MVTGDNGRMRLQYDVVDVFTDRPFAGNQLAVVHGAEALSDGQLLRLANEFGYSETTFPTAVRPDRYAVRILTPEREIAFAGHPTLGTAWVLRERGLLSATAVVQECLAGEVGVRLGPEGQNSQDSQASQDSEDVVELSATPRDLAGPLPVDLVGRLLTGLGLCAADLAGEAWVAGCGLSFVQVPVTEEALLRARAGAPGLLAPLLADGAFDGLGRVADLLDAVGLYTLEESGEPGVLGVHARVFVPGAGVPEDPATGSAAAGLGMALVATGVLEQGGRYRVRQGVELGRPSVLHGRVEVAGDRAVRCHVAGGVRAVARGEIELPPLS